MIARPLPVARNCQNVLDDRLHPVESVTNVVGVLERLGLLEQVEIALCDAERIAQVVTDDPREGVQPLVLLAEFSLAALSFGDIADDADRAHELLVADEDGDLGLARNSLAGFRLESEFDRVRTVAAGEQRADHLSAGLDVGLVEDDRGVLAE